MKKINRLKLILKSKTIKVLTALIMIICLALTGFPFAGHKPSVKAKTATPKYGTMKVWRWDKLDNLGDRTDSFWALIMYEADGKTYFSSGDGGRDKTHWSSSSTEVNPYISSKSRTFYTRERLDSPYFEYKGSDGSNANCRKYYLTMYVGNDKKNRINWKGTEDIQRSDHTDQISVIDSKQYAQKGQSMDTGEFKMFFNKSAANDIFLFGRAGEFYGDGSGGGWPGTKFTLYQGTEDTYSCLNNNYTIDPDQVLIVDSDVIITEDATLTVPEGAVLVVKEGALFVNGTIVLNGGTMLVEKGGLVMPFESKKNGCRIVINNAGSLIVRSGGRVYAGCPKGTLLTGGTSGWLDLHPGGSIVNFGLIAAGQINFYKDSIVELHPGSRLALGYVLTSLDKFLDESLKPTDSVSKLGLEANKNLGSILKSNITLYSGATFMYAIDESKLDANYKVINDGKVTEKHLGASK
ncbi:MAG: hypothetical protein IKS09_04060 [Lachnospiraceae bacterium]|nr:hypothetical protein [Lachnospiraceae bacterium]